MKKTDVTTYCLHCMNDKSRVYTSVKEIVSLTVVYTHTNQSCSIFRRSFIQEKEVPKSLKVSKSLMSTVKERMSIFKSRFTVTEHDPWFQTRTAQLDALGKQLGDMQVGITCC